MATRENNYAATEGSTSTSSSTFSDIQSLTFTPTASTDYLVLSSYEVDAATGSHCYARLYHDTASSEKLHFVHRAAHASELRQVCAFMVYEAPGSPVSQTFSTEFADRFNFVSHSMARRRMLALALTANDGHSTLSSAFSTTSDAYQSAHTLTFTPSTSGDYLILACAQVGYSGTGNPLVQLDTDGTTTHADTQVTDRGQHASAPSRRASFFAANVATLAAASKTITLQLKSSVSGQAVSIDKACIVALRLDDFSETFTAEDHTGSSTTSATFVDALSDTQTLSTGEDYLFIGNLINYQTGGDAAEAQSNVGGTTIAQPYYDPNVSGSEAGCTGLIYRATASGSTEFDLQYRKAGSSEVFFTAAVTAMLRLETPSGGTTYNDSISEGVDAGSTLGAAMTAARSISEGLDAGETLGPNAAFARSLTQGVNAGTALTVISGLAASSQESLDISAVEAVVSGVNASLGDSVGLAAAEVASLALTLAITQGVTADASEAGGFVFADSITESASAAASESGVLAGVGSISEAIAAAAAQAVVSAIAASISEGATVAESQTLPVNNYSDSITEAVGLTASEVGSFALNAALTQGASVQDAVAAAAAYIAAVAEALSIAENIVGSIGGDQDILDLASTIARTIGLNSTINQSEDLTSTILRILELESER